MRCELFGVGLLLATGCGAGINHPPFLAPVPDQTIEVGETLTFRVSAEDPDGDTVHLEILDAPSGATLDASGFFSWKSLAIDGGTHFVTLVAKDDGKPPLQSAILVSIFVHDPLTENHPPIWYGLPAPGTANVGVLFAATFAVIDPEEDEVTFSAPNQPAGATLESPGQGLGEFRWTPTTGDIGDHSFAVFAIDHGIPSMSAGTIYPISVSP